MGFWDRILRRKDGSVGKEPSDLPKNKNEAKENPVYTLDELLVMLDEYFFNLDKMSFHLEKADKMQLGWKRGEAERKSIREKVQNGPVEIIYDSKKCLAELLSDGLIIISGVDDESYLHRIESDEVYRQKVLEENRKAEIFEEKNKHFVENVCGGREKANKVIDLLKDIKRTLSELHMEKKLRDQISLLEFQPQVSPLAKTLINESAQKTDDDSKILAEIRFFQSQLDKFLVEEKPALTVRLFVLVEELKGLVNLKS